MYEATLHKLTLVRSIWFSTTEAMAFWCSCMVDCCRNAETKINHYTIWLYMADHVYRALWGHAVNDLLAYIHSMEATHIMYIYTCSYTVCMCVCVSGQLPACTSLPLRQWRVLRACSAALSHTGWWNVLGVPPVQEELGYCKLSWRLKYVHTQYKSYIQCTVYVCIHYMCSKIVCIQNSTIGSLRMWCTP